jgi:hypothetical protein
LSQPVASFLASFDPKRSSPKAEEATLSVNRTAKFDDPRVPVVEPLFSAGLSFLAFRVPKSPPELVMSSMMKKQCFCLPEGAVDVPSLAAPASLTPNTEGPRAISNVDEDAGASSSGFLPNSPPPKKLPAGAVLPDEGVDGLSAGFGTVPNSPPVGGVEPSRQNKYIMRSGRVNQDTY